MKVPSKNLAREDLLNVTENCVLSKMQETGVEEHFEFVRSCVRAIFEQLPMQLKGKGKLSSKECFVRKVSSVLPKMHQLIEQQTGMDPGLISSIQESVCGEVAIAFYEEFIDDMVENHLIPFLSSRKLQRWGLGTMSTWSDESGDFGANFYWFWRHHVEKNAREDEIFRRVVLSRLPAKWQKRYKPNGYEIVLRSENAEDLLAANSTHDLDALHSLAQSGNGVAFERLADLLRLHFQGKFPQYEMPDGKIERLIHMHQPVVSILAHADEAIRKYNRVNIRGALS